jgi:hypothetical protein
VTAPAANLNAVLTFDEIMRAIDVNDDVIGAHQDFDRLAKSLGVNPKDLRRATEERMRFRFSCPTVLTKSEKVRLQADSAAMLVGFLAALRAVGHKD